MDKPSRLSVILILMVTVLGKEERKKNLKTGVKMER